MLLLGIKPSQRGTGTSDGQGWFGLSYGNFNSCSIAFVACSQAVEAYLGSVKLGLLCLAVAVPQIFHLFLLGGQGGE